MKMKQSLISICLMLVFLLSFMTGCTPEDRKTETQAYTVPGLVTDQEASQKTSNDAEAIPEDSNPVILPSENNKDDTVEGTSGPEKENSEVNSNNQTGETKEVVQSAEDVQSTQNVTPSTGSQIEDVPEETALETQETVVIEVPGVPGLGG